MSNQHMGNQLRKFNLRIRKLAILTINYHKIPHNPSLIVHGADILFDIIYNPNLTDSTRVLNKV